VVLSASVFGQYRLMEQLIILLGTFLFPPLLGLVILVIVLATFGKSLGIRRKYVATLLRIFEVRVQCYF
jgi:hypothetical protein